MEKKYNIKNLIIKKALPIFISVSVGVSAFSDIGPSGRLMFTLKKNEKAQNDESISTTTDEEYTRIQKIIEETTTVQETTTFNKTSKEKTTQTPKVKPPKETTTKEETTTVEETTTAAPLEEKTPLYEYQVEGSLSKEFSTGEDDCFCIQGGTVAKDKIIIARKKLDTDYTYLYIINKDTLEVESIISDKKLGHCNDIAYNPDIDCLLITGKDNYNNIVILDANNYDYITEFESPHQYFALTYDSSTKCYIAFGGKSMYILNEFFEEINEFSVPTKLTKQGITVKDGLIYYLCWEKGVVSLNQTSVDLKRANTNYIFVYNYAGQKIAQYYIPEVKGEGEAIMFDENELIISLNGYTWDKWKLYKININPGEYISKEEIEEKTLF